LFFFSSISLLIGYLWVPTAGRLAVDGFYFCIALVVSSILGGIGGLFARFSSSFNHLDIELSVVPIDPSEIFGYALLLLPVFTLLRLLSEAFDQYMEERNRSLSGDE
jgi:hypothetical protein